MSELRRAIVLAAGRGTRMSAATAGIELTPEQRALADLGLKGLIPINGIPFLSYVLSALADAGVEQVCLVRAPDAPHLEEFIRATRFTRIELATRLQDVPRGSAHALLAAEDFGAGGSFVVVNGDNYYRASSLRLLGGACPATVGFTREGLRRGNIPDERIAAFALMTVDSHGNLSQLVEKPDADTAGLLGPDALVSMTCWRFDATIFEACRGVTASSRGELELPAAVSILTGQGAPATAASAVRVFRSSDPVLDLTQRGDIPMVERLLRDVEVRL